MSRSIVALSLQHEGCYTARTGPDHSESEVAGIWEQSYAHGAPCLERGEIVHLIRADDTCTILAQ